MCFHFLVMSLWFVAHSCDSFGKPFEVKHYSHVPPVAFTAPLAVMSSLTGSVLPNILCLISTEDNNSLRIHIKLS